MRLTTMRQGLLDAIRHRTAKLRERDPVGINPSGSLMRATSLFQMLLRHVPVSMFLQSLTSISIP
jgi:hypothetical protein